MQFLLPATLVVFEQITRRLLDKEWGEEVRKAMFSSVMLLSVILGLPLPYMLLYAGATILLSLKGKAVYSTIFGGILAYFSYISTNPFISIIPLTLMSIAVPTSYFLNQLIGRKEKGLFWGVYMFLVSSALTAIILVSFGPLNPLWGLIIGAVSTWAAKYDDSFSLPLFSFIAVSYVYAPLSGLAAGFGFSLIASSFAYYLKALDFNGLIGAVIVGMEIYPASPVLFLTMLAFLVSAAILGKFAKHDDRFQTEEKRNAIQVLSNAFGVTLAGFLLLSGQNALALGIVAIAASTADTWATEIGSKSKKKPRMITTLKPVESGKSGGVTPLGLMASLLAGFFIFLITFPFFGFKYLIPAIVGGAIGSLVDSLFGAIAQGIYRCRICSKTTEQENHCGKSTILERGIWWLNNDMVNLISPLIAMLVMV